MWFFRIVGAECMLSSFRKGKKLNRTPVPLFSFAMQDLNVCCTNMEKKQRVLIYSLLAVKPCLMYPGALFESKYHHEDKDMQYRF